MDFLFESVFHDDPSLSEPPAGADLDRQNPNPNSRGVIIRDLVETLTSGSDPALQIRLEDAISSTIEDLDDFGQAISNFAFSVWRRASKIISHSRDAIVPIDRDRDHDLACGGLDKARVLRIEDPRMDSEGPDDEEGLDEEVDGNNVELKDEILEIGTGEPEKTEIIEDFHSAAEERPGSYCCEACSKFYDNEFIGRSDEKLSIKGKVEDFQDEGEIEWGEVEDFRDEDEENVRASYSSPIQFRDLQRRPRAALDDEDPNWDMKDDEDEIGWVGIEDFGDEDLRNASTNCSRSIRVDVLPTSPRAAINDEDLICEIEDDEDEIGSNELEDFGDEDEYNVAAFCGSSIWVDDLPSCPRAAGDDEDLSWDIVEVDEDEIEDFGDEHKKNASTSCSGLILVDDLPSRLKAALDDEDLSWDIEDDEPPKERYES